MNKIYNVLLVLCLGASILLLSIECFALPLGPRINVYYEPGIYAAPFEAVKAHNDRARRIESHIFKVSFRRTLKMSPIADKCPGIFYANQHLLQFFCLWEASEKKGLLDNNKIVHFLIPTFLDPENSFRFALGGDAFRSCFKNLHPNNAAGGFAVSNFVERQKDNTSRIDQSLAADIHEDGHASLGLAHDGPEENYLMNTNFNVLGFSKANPKLWKISEKSRKQIKNCLNFRSHK